MSASKDQLLGHRKFQSAVISAVCLLGLGASPIAGAAGYFVTDIGPVVGNVAVEAWGLNASGQVVGNSGATASGAFITGPNGIGMTDIGTLGGSYSGAFGINDSGQVVGFSMLPGNAQQRAFVTGPGGVGITELGTSGAYPANGWAINASGQVAGFYVVGAFGYHGFVTKSNGSAPADLGGFGGTWTNAIGINDAGQVVGVSNTMGDLAAHAFISDANGGGLSDLGTLGGYASVALDINNSGQVVGRSLLAGNTVERAFITGPNGGEMMDLGTLGGDYSVAWGINASGQVVGGSFMSDGIMHAFVTGANGQGMIDVNSLVTLPDGAIFSEAHAINDLGQFVVNATNRHAYLVSVTSVPEPGSYALMLAGLGLVGLVVRHRKSKHTSNWVDYVGGDLSPDRTQIENCLRDSLRQRDQARNKPPQELRH